MYSWKVKGVMLFMAFLMSVGFAVLIIQPFLGGSLFGDPDGSGATRTLIKEARATVRTKKCAGKMKPGKLRSSCKRALQDLGAGYQALAQPNQQTQEPAKNAERYMKQSLEAYQMLYELDPADDDSTQLLAASFAQQNKADKALPLYRRLAKENADNPDYLYAWGATAQQAQKNDEAKKAFQLLLKVAPEDASADTAREALKAIKEQEKAGPAAGGGAGAPISLG